MPDRLRRLVLGTLRIPPEPVPPAGDPAAIRVFRAAPGYFRYRLLAWLAGQLGTLIGLVFGVIALGVIGDRVGGVVATALGALEVLAWLGYLAQIPYTLAALRLDYEMRWYMLSDRALRIREGIVSVREKTMTFANIQQIGVRQGPVQRLLGIADVEVRTAGGGSGSDEDGGSLHRGYFRGVEDAEGIRDTLRDRVRRERGAGLGDPGDEAPAPSAASSGSAATLAAARELLEETRTLRRALV
ncbi:MAG: PH domain-containing protein [Gemmatimonadetes bacterium]|nr:PH domain-containing protein [Gemmatimonadota bacterium]NIQ55462.1 PH domain-containing protein [Gemmatimonadota bacterium]NIU75671.1 PH domain-containing protein [Gammaproteobacteria bacterium]NIX45342.1 PH domain-containing protein [Gemmatimonadota bacterium]NIY09631.1 PH domain-containing protein [Gemmatimonadota bacterium]